MTRGRTGWYRSNQALRREQKITFIMCIGTDKGEQSLLPDIGVPLHIQVVEVVGALSSTKVGSLQPLDYLGFHHPGYVSRQ